MNHAMPTHIAVKSAVNSLSCVHVMRSSRCRSQDKTVRSTGQYSKSNFQFEKEITEETGEALIQCQFTTEASKLFVWQLQIVPNKQSIKILMLWRANLQM